MYDEIDKLNNQVNDLYNKQVEQQNNIINTSTEQTVAELQRQQREKEEEAQKTNRALYNEYQKQINPYGVNAENLYEDGLQGSGLAETTKQRYYNTYQTARTEATNNANKIKADFDAQMAIARQNGDLQKAQAALNMYSQQVDSLYNLYNLKYQVRQDEIQQNQWQQQYNLNKQAQDWQQVFNQAQFDYQKEQDAWERAYASKKAKSSSSSGGTAENNTTIIPENSYEDILKNVQIIQGAGLTNNVKDGLTGRSYGSLDELLASYGYARLD